MEENYNKEEIKRSASNSDKNLLQKFGQIPEENKFEQSVFIKKEPLVLVVSKSRN